MTDYDTRVYVLGNLKLMTGVFGASRAESISYDGVLSTVLAAGGHIEDYFPKTGTRINNGGGYSAGETGEMTVGTVDARLNFNVDEDLYSTEGTWLGTISHVNATMIRCLNTGLQADVADGDHLAKFGPKQPSVTLVGQDFHVGVDTGSKRVTFTFGSAGATETDSVMGGRFWILGTR
mgnify:FL=1|jgi:hypothetical protein|tara:strand:- start:125 stop:658 length:534 start_codon:yes stop_codon:yes gene_type:complete